MDPRFMHPLDYYRNSDILSNCPKLTWKIKTNSVILLHFIPCEKTTLFNISVFSGMLIFLNVIVFHGVSPNCLINSSSDIKSKIQSQVQQGIELDIVKPFDRHVLTGLCTGERAIKALKYTQYLTRFKLYLLF